MAVSRSFSIAFTAFSNGAVISSAKPLSLADLRASFASFKVSSCFLSVSAFFSASAFNFSASSVKFSIVSVKSSALSCNFSDSGRAASAASPSSIPACTSSGSLSLDTGVSVLIVGLVSCAFSASSANSARISEAFNSPDSADFNNSSFAFLSSNSLSGICFKASVKASLASASSFAAASAFAASAFALESALAASAFALANSSSAVFLVSSALVFATSASAASFFSVSSLVAASVAAVVVLSTLD